MKICTQANNSTLPATHIGAKTDYSARANNLAHSSSNPAAQAFVLFLQESFPELRKIRIKKHTRHYVVRVKTDNRSLRAKGYSVENAARNFLTLFIEKRKELAV